MSDKSYRNCTAPYDEQWAEVELFRWQYGELPNASDDRKLDIMKGLGMLGEALGTPGTPVDLANASQAIMRAAHEIDRLQAENERLREFVDWMAHGECEAASRIDGYCEEDWKCPSCRARELLASKEQES